MAVLLLQESPGVTAEQYDEVDELLRTSGDDMPDGLIEHVAAFDGDTCVPVSGRRLPEP